MGKNSLIVTVCMFTGMLLGLAFGYIVGKSQDRLGIIMCYGFVFGMILGVGIGIVYIKFKDKGGMR